MPHLHCHLLRQTCAMHLLEACVPVPTISNRPGHSHIESTRLYARVTERMKREALSKLSEDARSLFKGDAVFKYADDEEMLMTLCGLKKNADMRSSRGKSDEARGSFSQNVGIF